MNGITRSTVYGKIVPALAILLGLSYAFLDSQAISNALLFALVATAALGWLAPAGCRNPEELAAHAGRRDERRALRADRRALRHGQVPQGAPEQPTYGQQPQANPQANPQTQPPGQPGVVLEGIPQDRLPDEGPPR